MKYFLSFFAFFFFLKASSQEPEIIGKAIYASFLKGDTNCFKYYLSDSVFKVKFSPLITGFEESVKSGETSWDKIAKFYEITRTIKNKSSFMKALKEKIEVEERNKWKENIKKSKTCSILYQPHQGLIFKKLSKNGNEQSYFLIVNTVDPFAIKFNVYKVDKTFFLESIHYSIFLKDENGQFSCTISCNDGKELRICDFKQ